MVAKQRYDAEIETDSPMRQRRRRLLDSSRDGSAPIAFLGQARLSWRRVAGHQISLHRDAHASNGQHQMAALLLVAYSHAASEPMARARRLAGGRGLCGHTHAHVGLPIPGRLDRGRCLLRALRLSHNRCTPSRARRDGDHRASSFLSATRGTAGPRGFGHAARSPLRRKFRNQARYRWMEPR